MKVVAMGLHRFLSLEVFVPRLDEDQDLSVGKMIRTMSPYMTDKLHGILAGMESSLV